MDAPPPPPAKAQMMAWQTHMDLQANHKKGVAVVLVALRMPESSGDFRPFLFGWVDHCRKGQRGEELG